MLHVFFPWLCRGCCVFFSLWLPRGVLLFFPHGVWGVASFFANSGHVGSLPFSFSFPMAAEGLPCFSFLPHGRIGFVTFSFLSWPQWGVFFFHVYVGDVAFSSLPWLCRGCAVFFFPMVALRVLHIFSMGVKVFSPHSRVRVLVSFFPMAA